MLFFLFQVTFLGNQVILIAERKRKRNGEWKMACFLALLLLLGVTYLGGRMVLRCFHITESFLCPAVVAGSVLLLLYMCIWQVVVVKCTLPFSVLKYAGIGYFCAALLVGSIFEVREKRTICACFKRNKRLVIVNVLLFVLLVVDVQMGEPYFGGDMTVEETVTILQTGTVCRYHPATGAELVLGMNPGAKMNCIPGLYAVLCDCTGADVYTFICRFVPVWGLIVNWAAVFWLLTLVFGKKRSQGYTACGMGLYGILLLFGGYHRDSYAYRLLHQGFCPQVMLWATGSVILLCCAVAGIRGIYACRERRIAEHAENVE